MVYTDSFDHALDIVPTDCELIVITSEMFHDWESDHHTLESKVPDKEKDANRLAKMIKEINPNAKVYAFSEYGVDLEFVDGYIQKHQMLPEESISGVLKILKKK